MSRTTESTSGTGSIATLFIVVGAILLFFPEPATSLTGILLLLLGVLIWLVDWAT